MGIILRLLIWLALLVLYALYRVGEMLCQIVWITYQAIGVMRKEGFSKAELQYRGHLQDVLDGRRRIPLKETLEHPFFYIVFFAFLVIIAVGNGVWYLHDQYQQQRIAETRQLLDKLADDYRQRIETEGEEPIAAGTLPEHDAWDGEIVFARADSIIGTQLTMTSPGPDGQVGTEDDLVAIRFRRASGAEISGELLEQGKTSIVNQFKSKLSGDKPEEEVDQSPDANEETAEIEPEPDKPGWKVRFQWGVGKADANDPP